MDTATIDKLTRNLTRLRADLPPLVDSLQLSDVEVWPQWQHVLDHKLLPRLSAQFPLVVAICGGGSSGKSTLFNTLVGKRLSPVGGRAGMNRRVLISIHPDQLQQPKMLAALYAPFEAEPKPLTTEAALTTAGDPLYVSDPNIPPHLVLMDTPDFDTGARGRYTNRRIARQALEAADIFIYVFTNSNYNNRDNTDFMTEMLTGVGMRKSLLVYRVYPSFSAQEVASHAMTVARNIYGDDAEDAVLGVFRANEDNAVAAGEQLMQIRAVPAGAPNLVDSLERLDRRRIRLAVFDAMIEGVLATAESMLHQAQASRESLALYLDGLRAAQSLSLRHALRQVPTDLLIRRFATIWMATDPPHIRFMRKTGKILDLPLRVIVKAVKWVQGPKSRSAPQTDAASLHTDLRTDVLDAASELFGRILDDPLAVALPADDPVTLQMAARIEGNRVAASGLDHVLNRTPDGQVTFSLSAHPAMEDTRGALRRSSWRHLAAKISEGSQTLAGFTTEIDRELQLLADRTRQQFGFWHHTRQTLSAMLNVLPATAAVTYVLSTGDPVGAVGIKVKLAGLFGLHDLYALVALPATSGLQKVDRQQLNDMLAPVIRAWLDHNLKSVQDLFEAHLTGPLFDYAQRTLEESGVQLARCQEGVSKCRTINRS